MERLPAWRALLGRIIHDSQERQRIANELGVNPITLIRWANNTSNPRPQNLHHLLKALPQYSDLLLELLPEEFKDFSLITADKMTKDASAEIPSEFYVRILHAYSTTPQTQRFWSISNLILQQALGQLDPNRLGLAITIAQCMPPSNENIIRSLRERMGRGTSLWDINLEQQAIFLGEESMAGYVATKCHPLIVQSRSEGGGMFPAHWVEWEESAAAYPVMRANNIAACLLISSTQQNYFLPHRCTLIERYAELMTLVFEPEEFYSPQQINLSPMPFYLTQAKYLSSFQRRVSNVMLQATHQQRMINLIEAQQLVWQQLEEELLQLSPGANE